MLREWTAATVDPGGGPPSPSLWTPVEVPGRPSAFAGADAVAYRTTFPDPRDSDDDFAVLELRGVFAHATVWLDGERIAANDAYFEPIRVPFEPAPENELVVECRAPEDRFGGVHDTDLVPEEAAVPGIWWGVSVETHPSTYIADIEIRPDLSGDRATFRTWTTVVAGEPLDDRLTFSLRPAEGFTSRGMMDRAAVEAEAGERTTVEHDVDVPDPSLWWPRGYGQQNRYTIRAKLGESDRSATSALRTVERGEDGLLVNGRLVEARGVNLVDGTPADIERATDLNATMVRAHAHVLSPACYEACDEAGLLVWQDLPLTGPGEFDVDRGRELATKLARARGHHPSLAAVGIHDDPRDPFADGLGSGFFDRLRFRWRAWRTSYDRGPAEAVAEGVPDGLPVFPVVGVPGTDPDAATLYPGWDYGQPADVEWLLDRYPGLGAAVVEFGMAALGSADPEDHAGFDEAKHAERAPSTVDGSQAAQADLLRTITERLRVRGTPILAAFALRDTGDAGMGVITSDGDRKTGYGALQTSLEPVQTIVVDPSPGTTDAWVVNGTGDPVSATLRWSAGEADGETDLQVAAGETESVTGISVPPDADVLTTRLVIGDRTVENSYRLADASA